MKLSTIIESNGQCCHYGDDFVVIVGHKNRDVAIVKVLKSNRFKVGRLLNVPVCDLKSDNGDKGKLSNRGMVDRVSSKVGIGCFDSSCCPICGAGCFVSGVECGCGYKS